MRKIIHTAQLLPTVVSNTHEKHIMTGAEILEMGTITEIDGKPVNPVLKYTMPMPVQLYWNHVRRMKKAYQKEGYEGIKKYAYKVETIVKSQNKE